MTRIVALDGYTLNPGDLSWKAIEELGPFTVYDRTQAEQTVERSIDADILLVNKHILSAEIIDQLPNLKCICVTATGFNNVDIDHAASKNIPVSNVAGYSTSSVAQHVFSFILHFMNKPQLHNEAVQKGKWANHPDFSFHLPPYHSLERKILGIYGFGRIGQKVAEIAQAFNMQVIATHKHPLRDRQAGIQFVHLEELFETSDFISLHAPLNVDNVGIVNRQLLSRMKSTAYLINTARGPLINELDLKDILEKKKIAGAGLDVLSNEPPPADHPLFGLPNCTITPHMAWASVEARRLLMNKTVDNIKAFLEDRPRNVVNGV